MKPPTDKAIAGMAAQQRFDTLKRVVDEYLERLAAAAVGLADNAPEWFFEDGGEITAYDLDGLLENLRGYVDWIDEANMKRKRRTARKQTLRVLSEVSEARGHTAAEVETARRLLARKEERWSVRPRGPMPKWKPNRARQAGILADVIARYQQHAQAGTLPRGPRGIFYDLRPNGMGYGVTYRKPDTAHPVSSFGPMEAHPEAVREVVVLARRAGHLPEDWVADGRAPDASVSFYDDDAEDVARGLASMVVQRASRPRPAAGPAAVRRDSVRGR